MSENHLLQFEWEFWVIQIKQTSNGESYDIEPICSFDSVELFWEYFQQLPPISDLSLGGIGLFKKGISPAWEDPANANGISVSVRDVEWNTDQWENLILYIIGGNFENILNLDKNSLLFV